MNGLRKLMKRYRSDGYDVTVIDDYDGQSEYKVDLSDLDSWEDIEMKLEEVRCAINETEVLKEPQGFSAAEALKFVQSKSLLRNKEFLWTEEKSKKQESLDHQEQEKQHSQAPVFLKLPISLDQNQ